MNASYNDGLLRLREQDLRKINLVHLISGIDEEAAESDTPRCGGSTTLSGYTEWIASNEPNLTLGWDWQLDPAGDHSRVVRLGLPRTNVQLVSPGQDPLPWEQSLEVIASFIDTFDWNTPAFNAVCDRYAN